MLQENTIVLINSKNTFITCISVFNGINSSNQLNNSIFVNANDLFKYKKDIIEAADSLGGKPLVIAELTTSLNNYICDGLKFFVNRSKLILICNSDIYDLVSQSLSKICNHSKIEDRKYTFNDLNDESKRELIENEVFFQNKLYKLKELLGINRVDELHDDIKATIDLDIFNRIVCFGAEEDDKKDDEIYIERTFYRHFIINDKLLNAAKPNDLIALRNSVYLNKFKSRCIDFKDFNVDDYNTKEAISIFIVVSLASEGDEEFEALTRLDKLKSKNMHLLDFDKNGRLVWERTSGTSLSLIKKYIIHESEFSTEFDESFFGKVSEWDSRVFIISDEAGMGKTKFVRNLYKTLKNSAFDLIVIKIELNQCFNQLKAYTNEMNSDRNFKLRYPKRAFKFLGSISLFKNELDKHILEKNLADGKKFKSVVLLDGLDEICPSFKEAILDIIESLTRINRSIKLLLTTRPHFSDEMENYFGVLAYNMTKLSFENQKQFLIEYWANNSRLGLSEKKREEKAELVLKKVHSSINDIERELTGVPLQLKLISEIFLNEFSKEDELNLKILYEKFIEKKYIDIYSKEKKRLNLNDPEIEEDVRSKFSKFLEEHEQLAFLNLLLNNGKLKKFKSKLKNVDLILSKYENGSSNYGIVSSVKEKSTVFIHKTFQEYFVSSYLIKNIGDSEIRRFFTKHILVDEDYRVVRLFLNHLASLEGLSLNIKKYGKTILNKCLIRAANENLAELLRYTIKQGADVNANDESGKSALISCSENGNLTLVECLVEHGAHVDAGVRQDRDDSYEYTQFLMNMQNVYTMLTYFLFLGIAEYAISDFGDTSLTVASKNGHFPIVKYLIDKGASLDLRNKNEDTALILAANYNHADVARFLVENGANVNAIGSYGSTALIFSAKNGNFELAQHLVENGADINKSSYEGKTALIWAAGNGHLDIVKQLVDNGAHLNKADSNEEPSTTALCLACQNDRYDVAKYLVERKADLNETDENGNTALMIASKRGQMDLVDILLANRADVDLKNKNGQTALMFALQRYYKEIVESLMRHGAKLVENDAVFNLDI